MKTKIAKSIFNLIIISTIILILQNIVIPTPIYALNTGEEANKAHQQNERSIRRELVDELDEDMKQKVDINTLNEYIDEIRKGTSFSEGNSPNYMTDREGYKNWIKREVLPEYLNYYVPFLEETEGQYFINNAKKQEAFKNYATSKVIAEKENTGNTQTENQTNTQTGTEEVSEEIQNRVGEITGENDALVTELTQEEKERAEKILRLEDHSWWEQYFGWTEWVTNLPEKLAGAIVDFVCALADAVVNTLQEIMLPGSPTAVAERRPTTLFKRILGERGQDAFIYAFVKKEGNTWKYGTAVEPVALIYYGPGAIFSNKIPAFDVNFIDSNRQIGNPYVTNEAGTEIDYDKINQTQELLKATRKSSNRIDVQNDEENLANIAEDYKGGNTAAVLQPLIAKWYIALRDLALVGLLIVLVYLGIRMLISSSAEEQAKYKVMIKDWVIGIIVILMIHLAMSFLLYITNLLIDICDVNISVEGDELMNKVRTEIAHYRRTEEFGLRFGYCMVYLVLIWYTIMFSWQYLKRTIYLAFLTVVSPLVGLTYPIDKVKDGQAQALNTWMREYIFNLLLQPIHLLVYKMLVLMAIDLMEINIIYAVVAIGFLLEAESFIKKMFNFQSQGGGNSGAVAAGTMFGSMMTGLKRGSAGITRAVETGLGTSNEQGEDGKVRLAGGDRTADSDAPKNFSAFTEGNGGSSIAGSQPLGVGTANRDNSSDNGTISTGRRRVSIGGNGQSIPSVALPSGKIPNLNNNKNNSYQPSLYDRFTNIPVIRGLGRVRGRYINMNTAKKAAVLAAKGLGAGIFGMIGVGAGLASDDYANVFKMGAAGLAGGAMLGGEVTNQVGQLSKKAVELGDSTLKGVLGDEYDDKVKNKKEDAKWYYSEETRKLYIRKYGSRWREKRAEALELRKQGITDESVIEKAIKLKDDPQNAGLTIRQAGNIMKFEGVTRAELIEEKTREKVKEQVTELVGGDVQLGGQILSYLDQRFNLNTEKIEHDIEQKKEDKQREQQKEKEQQAEEQSRQEKEADKEKDVGEGTKKKKTKDKNKKEKSTKEKHPLKEVSGVPSSAKKSEESKGSGKHPVKEVSGVKSPTMEEAEKEKEEQREDIKKREENRQNDKIRFKENE